MRNLPLRTVTQRDDELQTHDQNTSVPKDNEDVFAHVVSKRIHLLIGQGTSNEVESKVEISLEKLAIMLFIAARTRSTYQTKVGKHQVEELIHKFNMKQDLARQSMIRVPDLLRIENGVHGSKESTVQPTTTLRDELGNRV